jgi:transcriptional regulator with XRE-family HTH domain
VTETELGAFIRSRRESVAPADVGLPEGNRRRTPGLRRSELATLAGISVDYLVRLEQGRDRRPSASVIFAIAGALLLGEEDRMHLGKLAMISQGEELCPSRAPTARVVRPNIRAVLDSLEPTPALVLNHLADVLAWTDTYAAIAGPIGILDDPEPNLVRFTFTDPRARAALPDWDRVAVEQVANLRAARIGDPDVEVLVEELRDRGGAEFTSRWDARPVERKGSGLKRLMHPEVGELRLSFETMQLADADHQRLVVYLAADDATAASLDQLSGRRPGSLRAVSTG